MKKLLGGVAQRSLQEQLEAEACALGVCAATEDFAEAIGAFLAKRKPAFKGRSVDSTGGPEPLPRMAPSGLYILD